MNTSEIEGQDTLQEPASLEKEGDEMENTLIRPGSEEDPETGARVLQSSPRQLLHAVNTSSKLRARKRCRRFQHALRWTLM